MIRKIMCKGLSMMALLAAVLVATSASAAVYELRTYTTNEGKLDNLHARFRDHTVKIFDKHGMKSVGYWVPVDAQKSKNTLIYVLEHKSIVAAQMSWKAFVADPQWHKVAKESQLDGQILAKAPESVYMTQADFAPAFTNANKSADGIYELRIYKTGENKLGNLNARFRDHTIGIFDRFAMESVSYWHPIETPDKEDTLIYILRHESADAAGKSWRAFGSDEEWKKVAKESQLDGRILRARPEAIYMRATDYSALQ